MTENNTSKKIGPSVGFRLLESHEVVRQDDEYWVGRWARIGADPARSVSADEWWGPVRRPIRLDPSDPNYRLLEEGETILLGDQHEWNGQKWRDMTDGAPAKRQAKVGDGTVAHRWRRRIETAPKAEPERFVQEYDDNEYVEGPQMTRLERVAAGLERDPYITPNQKEVNELNRERITFGFASATKLAAQHAADIARILRGKSEAVVVMDDPVGDDL